MKYIKWIVIGLIVILFWNQLEAVGRKVFDAAANWYAGIQEDTKQQQSTNNQLKDYKKNYNQAVQFIDWELDNDTWRQEWIEENIQIYNKDIYAFAISKDTGVYPWKSFPLYYKHTQDMIDGNMFSIIRHFNFLDWNNVRTLALTDEKPWYQSKENNGHIVCSQDVPFEQVIYVEADAVTCEIDHITRVVTVLISEQPFRAVRDFRLDSAAYIFLGLDGYKDLPFNRLKFNLDESLAKRIEIDARRNFDIWMDKRNKDNNTAYRLSLESFWKTLSDIFREQYNEDLNYSYQFIWK